MGCIVVMTISSYLSYYGEHLSGGEFIFGVLALLLVGCYILYAVSKPLSERFNPILIKTILGAFAFVAVFCAFVLIFEQIWPK